MLSIESETAEYVGTRKLKTGSSWIFPLPKSKFCGEDKQVETLKQFHSPQKIMQSLWRTWVFWVFFGPPGNSIDSCRAQALPNPALSLPQWQSVSKMHSSDSSLLLSSYATNGAKIMGVYSTLMLLFPCKSKSGTYHRVFASW